MKTIWITRELNDEENAYCHSLDLRVIEIPSIEVHVHPHEDVHIPYSAAWAFTSQHAVEWVENVIKSGNLSPDLLPEQWFAIGSKTAECVRKLHFEPIIPEEAYGNNLARLLDLHKVRSVLHFTGNLARPELKQACFILGINYHSFEVYETKVVPVKSIPKENPDYVLFLSPSAVEGFTSNLEAKKRLKSLNVLAIGKTTQQALLDYGIQSEISPKATFKSLVLTATGMS